MVGVKLEVACPSPPVRNDIVTPHHFFMKVTIIKSRLRIARYSYGSIFVSSPYVICSRDGVIVRVSLSVRAVLVCVSVYKIFVYS